jgi:hypothetical protein
MAGEYLERDYNHILPSSFPFIAVSYAGCLGPYKQAHNVYEYEYLELK